MPEVISGKMDASGLRFGLAAARFNEFITSKLVAGAVDTLERHGARAEQIMQLWVPGAWELPLAARKLAETARFDAVIALGCVIRGATPHFEYVAGECARGLAQTALQTGVPVSFGVLTTDTLEQAIERAGSKGGNKGADAARAAIEMANVVAALSR